MSSKVAPFQVETGFAVEDKGAGLAASLSSTFLTLNISGVEYAEIRPPEKAIPAGRPVIGEMSQVSASPITLTPVIL